MSLFFVSFRKHNKYPYLEFLLGIVIRLWHQFLCDKMVQIKDISYDIFNLYLKPFLLLVLTLKILY